MDITAIIAEYNPFHNGHLYHLQKTKQAHPNTFAVAILGGSFTQRAEPAFFTEKQRATWAIKLGFDAVVRLPAYSAFSDGENFAKAGVKVAQKIGATRLSFGSECGDLNALKKIADILLSPPPSFKEIFDQKMSLGISYPKALSQTFGELFPSEKYAEILNNPNDILAILYLKALKNTSIEPFCVKRADNGYESKIASGNMLSASSIRELILLGKSEIKDYLPSIVYNDIQNKDFSFLKDFSSMALYKLRVMEKEELSKIQDVTEGLENRIKKIADTALTIEELLSNVKTKRYTLSRLRRILVFALFDVTKEKFNRFNSSNYAKLLSANKENKLLISHLKKSGIVSAFSDLTKEEKELWDEENKMSDVLDLLLKTKENKNAIFI